MLALVSALQWLVFVFFVGAVVLGLVYTVPAIRYTPLVEPTIKDIDAAMLEEELLERPDEYIFLDVRSADAYKKLHAVGSKSQPLHTLYNERLLLPRNEPGKTIVLICSGGIASGVGYSYLEHYGFRNIIRVEGGIEAWQAKGLPVEGTDVLE